MCLCYNLSCSPFRLCLAFVTETSKENKLIFKNNVGNNSKIDWQDRKLPEKNELNNLIVLFAAEETGCFCLFHKAAENWKTVEVYEIQQLPPFFF